LHQPRVELAAPLTTSRRSKSADPRLFVDVGIKVLDLGSTLRLVSWNAFVQNRS